MHITVITCTHISTTPGYECSPELSLSRLDTPCHSSHTSAPWNTMQMRKAHRQPINSTSTKAHAGAAAHHWSSMQFRCSMPRVHGSSQSRRRAIRRSPNHTHTHTHAPHRRRKHARRTHAHSTHALTRHAPNGSHLNAFVPQVWRERAHSPRIGAAPALLVALPLCARTPLPTGRRGDARNTDTTS